MHTGTLPAEEGEAVIQFSKHLLQHDSCTAEGKVWELLQGERNMMLNLDYVFYSETRIQFTRGLVLFHFEQI